MKRAILSLSCLLPFAEARGEGHASAAWIAEKMVIESGSPVRTVIRMTIDKGWHTYWENPGEAGMPISLKADLPEGWKAGEINYPAPVRIMTSGLTSFCFEGEVLLPVTLTPPAGFGGKLPALHGTLSWLSCNDAGCVPGETELTLGTAADPKTVADAYSKLPKPIPGATLTARLDGDAISLTLTLPENPAIDPSACEVFPITRNVINPAAKAVFSKSADSINSWHASVAKSEYLAGDIGKLGILLVAADKTSWAVSTD